MTTAWVLHVDLDQFIAAVEVLRHPELKGKPVIVGGDGDPSKRGVVSTASYEAREFGVNSGMPLRTAAKKAPDAVFLAVDKEAYEAVSAEVMAVLREFSPLVEVLGWDEAFLAVDSGDPESVARGIQARVLQETSLHCSVGIGQNKIQAKLATGFGKPAGVFRITNDSWFEILGERTTDALWGIGSKTAKKLADLGVNTVWELARADYKELAKHFGPTTGPWLVWLARGRDTSPVVGTPYIPRSRSREVTFQRNLHDWEEVRAEIVRLAGQVVLDVEAEKRPVVRVVVKVRYAPFITKTHGQPLPEPTMEPAAIEEGALAALERFTERDPVRLLGSVPNSPLWRRSLHDRRAACPCAPRAPLHDRRVACARGPAPHSMIAAICRIWRPHFDLRGPYPGYGDDHERRSRVTITKGYEDTVSLAVPSAAAMA